MSIVLPRRGFLVGLASLLAAPAVVRASSLMPISAAKLLPSLDTLEAKIGTIQPIVGAIPDGWIECNGKWFVDLPDLHKVLQRDYVPDLRVQAAQDQDEGKLVGRYVIYAGQQRIDHMKELGQMIRGMERTICPPEPQDTWTTWGLGLGSDMKTKGIAS